MLLGINFSEMLQEYENRKGNLRFYNAQISRKLKPTPVLNKNSDFKIAYNIN